MGERRGKPPPDPNNLRSDIWSGFGFPPETGRTLQDGYHVNFLSWGGPDENPEMPHSTNDHSIIDFQ